MESHVTGDVLIGETSNAGYDWPSLAGRPIEELVAEYRRVESSTQVSAFRNLFSLGSILEAIKEQTGATRITDLVGHLKSFSRRFQLTRVSQMLRVVQIVRRFPRLLSVSKGLTEGDVLDNLQHVQRVCERNPDVWSQRGL